MKKLLAVVALALVTLSANAAVFEISRGNDGLRLGNSSSATAYCQARYWRNTMVTWDFTIPPNGDYYLLRWTVAGEMRGWRCRY